MPVAAPNLSRRALLLGKGRSRPAPQRPPYTLPEALFIDRCTGCGACIAQCPEGILAADEHGRPQVDFTSGQGECTFCGNCADACEVAAFLPAEVRLSTAPWSWRAAIGEACLTGRGVMCQSCKDACGQGAIRFAYAAGSVARPVIDPENCTGCGACQAPCPAAAISFVQVETADV